MSTPAIIGGAVAGFLVGGPLGAVVGALAGGVVASSPAPSGVVPVTVVTVDGGSADAGGGDSSGPADPGSGAAPGDQPTVDADPTAARKAAWIAKLRRPSPDEAQAFFDAALRYAEQAGVAAAFGPALSALSTSGSVSVAAPAMLAYFGPAFLASVMPNSPLTPQDVANLAPPAVIANVLAHVSDALDAMIFGGTAREGSRSSMKLALADAGLDPSLADKVFAGTASPSELAAVASAIEAHRFAVGSTGKDIVLEDGTVIHIGLGAGPGDAPSDGGVGSPVGPPIWRQGLGNVRAFPSVDYDDSVVQTEGA